MAQLTLELGTKDICHNAEKNRETMAMIRLEVFAMATSELEVWLAARSSLFSNFREISNETRKLNKALKVVKQVLQVLYRA